MKLIKQVVEIGNGAAVYVPKEYLGQVVALILPEGTREIQQRILTALVRYMPNILGVYLYGSYARDEQQPDSDIDILVVTKERDATLKRHLNDIDARVLPLDAIRKAIREHPLFIVPVIREAKVLLNPALLEELRTLPFNRAQFQWPLKEVERTVKIIETFLALDSDTAPIAPTHLYSLILRIRVCFLIECLLHNKAYTHKRLKENLMKQGFRSEAIERWFSIYRAVRDNEEPRMHIKKTMRPPHLKTSRTAVLDGRQKPKVFEGCGLGRRSFFGCSGSNSTLKGGVFWRLPDITKDEVLTLILFLKASIKKLRHETKKTAGKGY